MASDGEEEGMANDYQQQMQYDGMESMGGGGDIHAQLQAAATPLEFQATLETKFASYDNYCNLFHFILNSDGPVDLDIPSVRCYFRGCMTKVNAWDSLRGPGMSSTSSFTSSTPSAATDKNLR
jgi:hypothetical protein